MNPERLSECEKHYRIVVNNEPDPTKYVLFELAQCFLEGFDPQKLRDMLVSSNKLIVRDGIFVLGETGGMARDFAPEIHALAAHDDPQISRRAQKLRDVYLKDSPPK